MPITIAIDGFSSCGKSTLAKDLASKLGYIYVDSGAMYRAVTLHFLNEGTDINNPGDVLESLKSLVLGFKNEGTHQRVLLNNRIVEEELRTMEVNNLVSPVATLSAVRTELVMQQQAIGKNGSIVMDGRDIATVVFPQAELKLFVTASIEMRVSRRYNELQQRGLNTPQEVVKQNLLERDHIDSTRADSPLTKHESAVVIDNTNLSRSEQAAMSLALAFARGAR